MDDYRFYYTWIPVATMVIAVAVAIIRDLRRKDDDAGEDR